jgi:hypothetical protein
MTWDQYHSLSERLAIDAEAARRAGNVERAEALYREAAAAEDNALAQLPDGKDRTRGISAVSSVALWYKGHDYTAAERLAHRNLAGGGLPSFAIGQLRELLHFIWTAQAAERAGIRFVSGDVLVSVKGGVVIHGGAPLDLIVKKVEGIQAVLYRTVEMLLHRPFRRRGGPASDILSMFRPWLFQAPVGSYQFAVRVQEPEQRELWEGERPQLERVTETFFGVLRASASDPEAELPSIVPDVQYREAFLNLSRNLAPTGKTFERLEVRDAGAPAEPVALFRPDTRQQINAALRRVKPSKPVGVADEPITIQGVLRGVHLDQDWLELATMEAQPRHMRVDEASEALDDVVGPMVNRRVVVTAVRRGQKLLYRDIELDE